MTDKTPETVTGVNDLLELLLLAALWGGSFLLLRLTAPVFGPIYLIEMRVLMGAAVLLPLLIVANRQKELLQNWRIIALISLTNMCLPFCLLAFSSMTLGAGLISILNATVPFFAAFLGLLFFQQKLTISALAGLATGFLGVLILMGGSSGAGNGTASMGAFAAGLAAASLYGFSTNLINRRLLGISGLAITTGSLLFTALFLAPFMLVVKPVSTPEPTMWFHVFILGTFCTGLPYLLFYRLVMNIGAYRTLTVTYLVPMFGILYGALLLGETFTFPQLAGSLLVLLGVAVTTGRLRPLLGLRRH